MGAHRRWSPQEDDRLIQMADVDMVNHKVISTRLGRSLASIEKRLRTIRYSMPAYNDEPLRELRELPPAGESPFTIWKAAMGRVK